LIGPWIIPQHPSKSPKLSATSEVRKLLQVLVLTMIVDPSTNLLKLTVVPDKESHTVVTEITQPCVHTCNGLFICQLYSLPNLLEEMDCKEDTPLTLPFCIIRFHLTVDNSDMN
jgi:hypothetical protein